MGCRKIKSSIFYPGIEAMGIIVVSLTCTTYQRESLILV